MRSYKVAVATIIKNDMTVITFDTDESFVISDSNIAIIDGRKYKYYPGMDSPTIAIKATVDPKSLIGKTIDLI